MQWFPVASSGYIEFGFQSITSKSSLVPQSKTNISQLTMLVLSRHNIYHLQQLKEKCDSK